jgi:putative pyruvate formate lyase activating enzyme
MVVSLMAQYAPHHRAGSLPPLDRRITAAEYERVLDIAWSLGLERCFVQALDSRESLVPDFRAEDPFA